MVQTISHEVSFSSFSGQRIGVFVDVTNMFYTSKLQHGAKLNYGRLLSGLVGSRTLIRALAYILQKTDIDQSAFHKALHDFGYELRVKEVKVRVDVEGQPSVAKASCSVDLTLDAIALSARLDTVILITGDGSYIPLVEHLKARGIRVEICGFGGNTAADLVKAADFFIPIRDEWMFKDPKSALTSTAAVPIVSGLASTGAGKIDRAGLPQDD